MADLTVRPVAADIKPMTGMSLGEMINAAAAAQAYQQASQLNPLQLERAEAELQRLRQLTPEELRRAAAEAEVAEKTVRPRIAEAESKSAKAATETTAAAMDLQMGKVKRIADAQIGMINDPDIIAAENGRPFNAEKLIEKVKQNALRIAKDVGIPENEALKLNEPYMTLAQTDPKQLRSYYKQRHIEGLDQASRSSALFPESTLTNVGGAVVPVSRGSAISAYPAGVEAGGRVQLGLPVGTQVYNPQTGQYEFVGAPSSAAPAVAKPSAEKSALEQSRGAVISKDLPDVIAKAADAPSRIAIYQNIKKLAPESITGPTAERRQMIASFAQMLGISAYEAETAATDELLKNTNLLALNGGNTDAAREMARFANPNNKMTKEGIVRVTNQLISIEEMNMARARYMGPAQNNPADYFQRKLDFDAIADPRLFLDVDAAELKKIVDALSPREREKLKFKARKAKELGVIP